jgi:hypothetical protein
MKLSFHPYKYFPYERQLALREVKSLLGSQLTELTDGVEIRSEAKSAASRLVYFSEYENGRTRGQTVQARLERAGNTASSRQSTRYSVHGLHEYKGKFNPQIVKALLNISGVKSGDRVLDPFCGSGTTLVECAHMKVRSVGVDLNPLAVFLANAKLQALNVPAHKLETVLDSIERYIERDRAPVGRVRDEREHYLLKWFDVKQYGAIESVKAGIRGRGRDFESIFLAVASNLLREYSMQDPKDLRIRRRTSALPEKPFANAFLRDARKFIHKLKQAQSVCGCDLPIGQAKLGSIADAHSATLGAKFDAALTSPPYAMALPYIDTQRLSLVWLNLVPASKILSLDAELIGSRELRGGARRQLSEGLETNPKQVGEEQHAFCLSLQRKLSDKDGFRRQAVPSLLYRYFADMQKAFENVRAQLKPCAPFGLIVGHNHTVLSGIRCDINTPQHLASLARHVGWAVEEIIELQTYRRFGYHVTNAISSESLLVLRNSPARRKARREPARSTANGRGRG